MPSPDGVRHAQVGEAVDDADAGVHFCDLALEVAREESLAQEFDAIHRVLGKAAPSRMPGGRGMKAVSPRAD